MFKILRGNEVSEITGLSLATIYRLGKQGRMPKPIRLGKHSCGWDADQLKQWHEQRLKEAAA